LFIFALVMSAVYEPRIRVLHALQALIYIAVIVLARRNSPWGYGAGFVISTFWNYINLFVTTFIRNGVEQLIAFIQTGRIARPDLALSVIAATGHFLLIAACLVGFLRNRPSARECAQFVGGGVLAIAYFTLIIVTTGPQYIPILMNHSVMRRRRELAVRLALGAAPSRLTRTILRETLTLILAGLIVGFGLSVPLASLVAILFVGVTPTDMNLIFGVTAVIVLSSLVAVALPLWRVVRLEPLRAIREG
jgi:hypothetical protein